MITPELIGNQAVYDRLNTLLSEDRLPHAILIEGPYGSGRTTLARQIACAAACLDADAPCGRCAACLSGDSNPDITTVTTDKAAIGVDVIRQVRSDAFVKPNQSRCRVFIIPNAQRMNQQAQNALLKVLEEPPAGVKFVLTCEYARQLLETVVSRLSVFSLNVPERDEGIDFICEKYPQYSREDVDRDYETTVGAALDALAGAADYAQYARAAVDAVFKSESALMKALHPYEKDRAALKGICRALGELFHDALAVKMGAKRGFPADDRRVRLASRFTPRQLMRLEQIVAEGEHDCDANMGGALLVTDLCARIFRA